MSSGATAPHNLKGGVFGACVGGFAWIVLLGAVNGSAALLAEGLAFMIVGLLVGLRLAAVYPDRHRLVTGLLLLWLAAGNLLVLRLAWDEIPDRAFGISTGKQSVTLATLNVGLSAMALVGLGLLIRDVRRPKEEKKEEGMTPPPT